MATQWTTVILHPLPGSVDRVTVAAAAITTNGAWCCKRTFGAETLNKLLGDDAELANHTIALTMESVVSHMKEKGTLYGASAPVGGVSIGEIHIAGDHADDLDKFMNRAIALSSYWYDAEALALTEAQTTLKVGTS